MKNLSASSLACAVVIGILAYSNFNIARWKNLNVIDWDVIGFYAYLPATFIHHDYRLEFLRGHPEYGAERKFWPQTAPNGALVHKPTMGMALLYAPFFALAHIHTQSARLPPDGFTIYYHQYIHLSALFYLTIGLILLRRTLLRWFSDGAVATTLLVTGLGTNLFFYATTEAAMSHAYTFSLSAALLYLVSKGHDAPRWRFTALAGLCLGLMTLIRPVNALFALFPVLYGMQRMTDATERLHWMRQNWAHVLLFACVAATVQLPQLLYWKSLTGHWFFYSYLDEGFFFLKPRVLQGIFSFRNGWLVYTPIMAFALAGAYYWNVSKHPFALAGKVFLPVYLYVVFSWWCWWYVGFGNRAMIDSYAVMALPLAAVSEQLLVRSRSVRRVWIAVVLLAIAFNGFQTLQYRYGLVHFDGMNARAYLASFGRLTYTDAYKQAIRSPDYERAKRGEE